MEWTASEYSLYPLALHLPTLQISEMQAQIKQLQEALSDAEGRVLQGEMVRRKLHNVIQVRWMRYNGDHMLFPEQAMKSAFKSLQHLLIIKCLQPVQHFATVHQPHHNVCCMLWLA